MAPIRVDPRRPGWRVWATIMGPLMVAALIVEGLRWVWSQFR